MKQYLAFRRKPVRIGNELTLFYTVYLSIATMKLYMCVLYKQVHTLQWRVMLVEATCELLNSCSVLLRPATLQGIF